MAGKVLEYPEYRKKIPKFTKADDGKLIWMYAPLLLPKRKEPYISHQRFSLARLNDIEKSYDKIGFDESQAITYDIKLESVTNGNHRTVKAAEKQMMVLVQLKWFETPQDGLDYIQTHQDTTRSKNDDPEKFHIVLNYFDNDNYDKIGLLGSCEPGQKKDDFKESSMSQNLNGKYGLTTGYIKKAIATIKYLKTQPDGTLIIKNILDEQNKTTSMNKIYEKKVRRKRKTESKKKKEINIQIKDGHFYQKEGDKEIDLGYTKVNLIYKLSSTKFKKLTEDITDVYKTHLRTAKLEPANKE